jgi:arylsulfatase A-like enzyme
VVLDRVRLIDVAPTAARLLGIPAPAVEGRVLGEILR